MKITPLLRLCAVVSLSILSFSSCSKDKGGTGSSSADINVLDKITDPVFREYIELEMRLGHIKAAIPSVLTTQEAASVEELGFTFTANKEKLQSLAGIEYFTGIKKLYLNYTAVSIVDLSRNPNVQEVNFPQCTAESITVTSPTATRIYGGSSKCTHIKINAPRLTYLDCNYSINAKTFEIVNSPLLTFLDLGACKLPSIDVSGLRQLETLRCGGFGNISSGILDVSNNRKLKLLACSTSGNSPLRKLYVWWDGGKNGAPAELRLITDNTTEIIKK